MFKIGWRSRRQELKTSEIDLSKFNFKKVLKQEQFMHYIGWFFRKHHEEKNPEVIYLDSKEVLGYDEPTISGFQLEIDGYWVSYQELMIVCKLAKIYKNTQAGTEDVWERYFRLETKEEFISVHHTKPLTKEARVALANLIYEELTDTFKTKRRSNMFKIKSRDTLAVLAGIDFCIDCFDISQIITKQDILDSIGTTLKLDQRLGSEGTNKTSRIPLKVSPLQYNNPKFKEFSLELHESWKRSNTDKGTLNFMLILNGYAVGDWEGWTYVSWRNWVINYSDIFENGDRSEISKLVREKLAELLYHEICNTYKGSKAFKIA